LVSKKQVAITKRQATLDEWLVETFRDRLRKASVVSRNKNKPILLYRNAIEEVEYAAEEEIATVNEEHVIVQVLTHGGFIPPSFQQQYVFNLDEFTKWIMNRSRELFFQCLENIDEQITL
jgi:hypothetical protein